MRPSAEKKSPPHPEAKGLLWLALSAVALLSLLSFTLDRPANNWLGLIGYWIAWLLNYGLGLTSYLLVGYGSYRGWKLLISSKLPGTKTFYFALLLISCAFLLNLLAETTAYCPAFLKSHIHSESIILNFPYPHRRIRYNFGGVPFYYLYCDLPTFNLQRMLSNVGIGIIFSITSIVSLLLLTETSFPLLLEKIKKWLSLLRLPAEAVEKKEKKTLSSKPSLEELEQKLMTPSEETLEALYTPVKKELKETPIVEKIKAPITKKAASKPLPPIERSSGPLLASGSPYQIPPPSLLTSPKKVDQPSLKKELRRQAEVLEETLLSFGIEAKVGEIHCGPTIASFEVHPAVGVKVQKITALENDIALKLQAKTIRIIAPIPGKAAVGVEIPSLHPQEVSFKEMLVHYQHQARKFLIPVLLGKTVSGENVMSDLAKMPHCIIAGATGSGKSVCINTIIMSILMNARPDEIKLIMIDPKKVELTPYSFLPHMIAPVITEAHGAYAALNWLVKEMQTRYEILKQLGVRNILAFNNRTINQELESSLSIPIPEKMYAIVAIIDEFADLMMVSSSDLETPIARIAQMARAVGIHLILATQRPSREVITGLIKANFPTRIAFKVASRVNSQIILDENGAESLLGNGDMLFLPPGSSHLLRAQGVYISDEDIHQVLEFISAQSGPNYLVSSFDNLVKEENPFAEEENAARDSLYEQALQIVVETQTASTTFLQRKLKVGYARAASLMDELEQNGVIGPQEGSKPRRILKGNKGAMDSSLKKDEDFPEF